MVARSWAVALVLAVSAPIRAETPRQHVAAARAAEKRSEWRKALREWQAAYRMEINAEYLIGIGDAYSHLGNKAEARKQYQAYLADPLALPANAARVKAKIAALDGRAAGAAMALDLPAPADPKDRRVAAAPSLPPLDAAALAPLPLPELELPAAKTAAGTKKTDLALALPDLRGIAPTDPAKKQPPPAAQPPAGKPAQTLAATAPSAAAKPAVATPPPPTEPRKAPVDAIMAEAPRPAPAASGARRTVAWVAAGVAVVALGGGALAYSKASSTQSDLTGSVHDGPAAKSLLDSEKQYKTLSFVGLAGGLVAAGVSAALFAF
ncbi:MAG: hypothetical protein ACJ79H_09070 [Myxococcales bacterium]